jgi:hypothetical protein
MENRVKVNGNVNMLGFYVALTVTILAIVTFGMAVCTPPVSGPFCKDSCIGYPYTEILSRFPRDYFWMYPAMLLAVFFVVLMACIHLYASDNKKIFSLIGLSFSILSSFALLTDYFIQISVIQPSLLNGETDGIAMLTQYNPHGVFIALEEVGYIMMGLTFIFIAPVFSGSGTLKSAIRWVFIICFILIIISFAMISIVFGIKREYRFEVVSITIDYITLIVSGILLSRLFKREMRNSLTVRWALQNMSSIK